MKHLNVISGLLFFLFANIYCFGKISTSPDSIPAYFTRQTELFPQEKIYVQTDKPHYMAGDTIWFRAYLVDGCTHLPTAKSNFIYADLVNPRNERLLQIKIMNDKGVFKGQIELPDNLAVGNYILNFYTRYMYEEQPEYLFAKKISIESYFSTRYLVDANFKPGKKNENRIVDMTFKEFGKTELLIPDKVRFYDKKEELQEIPAAKDGHFRFELEPEEIKNNMFHILYTIGSNAQKQYLYVPPMSKDYDVSFFPEGGHLQGNCMTRIAFKALNNDGLGEDIRGMVLDSRGDTIIADFRSSHLGMGIISLICQPNLTYRVLCQNKEGKKKEFTLPDITNDALSLRADWRRGTLCVYLNRDTTKKINETLYLTIHCRGKVLYSKRWDKTESLLPFPHESLPTGVLQIILTNKDNMPLSERLVFNINKADATTVKFKTNKKSYDRRELVKASVQVLDENNNPLTAMLAVSVTDNGFIRQDTSMNILSTLLLTSDIKGHIEAPAYYFVEKTPEKLEKLDLLMMTQGWSRYDVRQTLLGNINTVGSEAEISQEIKGILYKGINLNKPAENFPVTMFVPETENIVQTQTKEDGSFSFGNLLFRDSTLFVVQGNTLRGKNEVKIEISKDSFAVLKKTIPFAVRSPEKAWLEEMEAKKVKILSQGDVARTFQLDEVTVTARYNEKESLPIRRSPFSSEFNKRTSGKELVERYHPATVMEMLQNVTGIAIYRDGTTVYPYMLNGNLGNKNPPAAYIIVDNMPTPPEELNSLMPQYIVEIEVSKSSVLLGSMMKGSGAIFITTSMFPVDQKLTPPTNVRTVAPLGYQVHKAFYSPKYETKLQKADTNTDNRVTVYWNPDIKTTDESQGEFLFYTSDQVSSYNVALEGLSNDGRLIHWRGSVTRKFN